MTSGLTIHACNGTACGTSPRPAHVDVDLDVVLRMVAQDLCRARYLVNAGCAVGAGWPKRVCAQRKKSSASRSRAAWHNSITWAGKSRPTTQRRKLFSGPRANTCSTAPVCLPKPMTITPFSQRKCRDGPTQLARLGSHTLATADQSWPSNPNALSMPPSTRLVAATSAEALCAASNRLPTKR